MSKRYAVWGSDKSYKWLWMAALAAGLKAAKGRYLAGKTNNQPQAGMSKSPAQDVRAPVGGKANG
jgi:hypothetical protein